jgi:Mrp family chromosome partitioning ATPase
MDDTDWQEAVHDYGGITVITSGTTSASSPLLLESDGMTRLLEKLQKSADVIIIDGPPLFIVDSQILASKVGGILLIVRQGSTITAVARAMLRQLNLMEVNVLGAILNRVPRAETYYFDGYYRNTLPDQPEKKSTKVKVRLN